MDLKITIPVHRFDLWRMVQKLSNTELVHRLESILEAKEKARNKKEEEFYSRRLKEVNEFLEESQREVERLTVLLEEFEKDRNKILDRLERYSFIISNQDHKQ
ncbi:MAG: hypothetical protein PWP37_1161 [Thermotogota bacterium]|nr:hypothetical protein [Thermotogota bacterium]MDK2864969.1 hypothetical protein [Thermotogota bacterium]HCZ07338.1 hypothetical protein [Thermotogota bacterium]